MRVGVSQEHLDRASGFVDRSGAGRGLARLDLGRFWEDQAASAADPFGTDIPQVPLGAVCNWECVFAELGVDQAWHRYQEDEVGMVAEFLRDFEMAREHRGLVFATAGSINNGSRLSGMRLIMAAIQEFGRYAG